MAMPTYHYHCNACASEFTAQLPFGSKALPACPSCSATNVQKVIKMPMIQFKGSGFYKTDSMLKPLSPKKVVAAKTETKTEIPPPEAKPTEKKAEKIDKKAS